MQHGRGKFFSALAAWSAFFIGAPALAALVPGKEAAPASIRVSLGESARVAISGEDLRLNSNARLAGRSNLFLTCDADSEQGAIVKVGSAAYPSPLSVSVPGGFVFVDGHPYREQVRFHARGNRCLVVNELELEKYVAGLINKEMAPHWPLEALKAQAVAARTYALYQRARAAAREYDVESNTQDQVYAGAETETPRSHQAVEETKGEVLSWQEAPIKAFYHANCAGHTEKPSAVWGEEYGYMRPVVCPYHHEARAQSSWAFAITKANLRRALAKIGGLIPHRFGSIASLQPLPINDSRRVERIAITDAEGKRVLIPTNKLRSAVGNTKLRSAAFRFRTQGSELQFYGSGFGHGVGMCQIGAREMARQGKTHGEILRYYYPLANLRTL